MLINCLMINELIDAACQFSKGVSCEGWTMRRQDTLKYSQAIHLLEMNMWNISFLII